MKNPLESRKKGEQPDRVGWAAGKGDRLFPTGFRANSGRLAE